MTERKAQVAAGAMFIVGDIFGVLGVITIGNILKGPGVPQQIAANQDRVALGALFVLLMGLSLAMIPLLLYPTLRRHSRPLALGYAVFRSGIETVTYLASAAALLLLISISRDHIGPSGTQSVLSALLIRAQDPVASEVGSIVFCIGALMLYWLLYQARLVPRWLSLWGVAGAVLYLAVPLAGMFGSSIGALMAPLAVQEIVFALWLIVRGLDTSSEVLTPALTSFAETGARAQGSWGMPA